MITYLTNIVNRLNSPRYYLIVSNFVLVVALIILFNLGVLPFKSIEDFLFFTLVGLFLALYRPGWVFLFFIGTIALENINLAPEELGVMIRPYQLIGFLTFLAVGIRYGTKRLNFKLPKVKWSEYVVVLFALGGFLGSLDAANSSLAFKQSIIICSFVVLYFLVRIFIQNLEDLKRIIPYFLSSSLVVVTYGIWQNWQFLHNKNNFEVMPGRINATFTEADWLGIFLVFLLSILYVLAYNLYEKIKIFGFRHNKTNVGYAFFVWFLIILSNIALVLTVARSAWLGAAVLVFAFIFYLALKKKIKLIGMVFLSIALAVALVYVLRLTNFELGNRIQSTASGDQEITIACKDETTIPSPIGNVSELKEYNCEHINLENIPSEMAQGKIIKKIYRKDPNVGIRAEIYKKSLGEIKAHWFLGIGWGNISDILGKDERGSGLNSSNIFLEVWLGAGLLGIISFVALVLYIPAKGKMFYFKKIKEGKFYREDSGMDFFYLFLILSSVAIIIPNLFNAGIMLGFFWLWLGIALVRH